MKRKSKRGGCILSVFSELNSGAIWAKCNINVYFLYSYWFLGVNPVRFPGKRMPCMQLQGIFSWKARNPSSKDHALFSFFCSLGGQDLNFSTELQLCRKVNPSLHFMYFGFRRSGIWGRSLALVSDWSKLSEIQVLGFVYTLKKGLRYSCPQPGCHLPNSPWAGIICRFPVPGRFGQKKSRNLVNFFYSVATVAPWLARSRLSWVQAPSGSSLTCVLSKPWWPLG